MVELRSVQVDQPRDVDRLLKEFWHMTHRVVAFFLFMCLFRAAFADEWPARPITVIVPYKAGGGGEGMVRAVAVKLSSILGQQVVVENRGGAGGMIGAAAVSRAKPDGYVFLVSGQGSTIMAPAIAAKPPFDASRDFTHIAFLGGPPPVLAVNDAFPAKTLAQFIEIGRASPGLPYASPGLGSHGHLIGELFKTRSKVNTLHVPYSGGGPAVIDLVSGQVPVGFMTLSSVSQQVRNGKMRILAIASRERLPDFPSVPTFEELGYPELTGVTWFGLSGPANLPQNVSQKLNAAVRQALKDPDVLAKLRREGFQTADMSVDQFDRFFRAEMARWTSIARSIPKQPGSAAPKAR